MNRGLQRIAEVLEEVIDYKAEVLVTIPSKAGHFLNLLSAIMQPFRHSAEPFPSIEEVVRDALVNGMASKFMHLRDAFDRPDDDDYSPTGMRAQLTDCTLFMARLLQFFLGFPDIWKGILLKTGDALMATILDLTLLHGQSIMTSPIAFTLLLDTVFYLFDGESSFLFVLGYPHLSDRVPI